MKKTNLSLKFATVCGAVALSFAFSTSANAANSTEMRAQCLQNLQTNLVETNLFAPEATDNLDALSYEKLEPRFSKYYKSLSSFGVDLDAPLFEWRIYSFGEQTGYVHPPYSPFPASTKADQWGEPTKQYIVLEEYVTDESGERNFVSCGLIQISAEDLMQVTGDNYVYDGESISVLKKADGYNAWYNNNTSYDKTDFPFVTWDRLFIYPSATQNDYFDRYSLSDALPANHVNHFRELILGYGATAEDQAKADAEDAAFMEIFKKYEAGEISEEEFLAAESDTGEDSLLVYEVDENGNFITPEGENASTTALDPVKRSTQDNVFSLNSYYAAIEAKFPAFAKHLALQGLVPYETVKTVLADPDNADYEMLWDTILDPKIIIQYSRAKLNGEITPQNSNSYYEDALEKIAVLSQKPDNIKPENLLTNKLTEEEKESFQKIVLENQTAATATSGVSWQQLAILLVLIILVPIVVFGIGRIRK